MEGPFGVLCSGIDQCCVAEGNTTAQQDGCEMGHGGQSKDHSTHPGPRRARELWSQGRWRYIAVGRESGGEIIQRLSTGIYDVGVEHLRTIFKGSISLLVKFSIPDQFNCNAQLRNTNDHIHGTGSHGYDDTTRRSSVDRSCGWSPALIQFYISRSWTIRSARATQKLSSVA